MFSCHPFVGLKDNDFTKNVLEADNLVLVEFMAEWCGACHIMAPVMNEISKQYGNKIKIYKVDIEKEKELADKFSVKKVPTIIIFNNGNVVDFTEGIISKKVMLNKIKILFRNESIVD